MQKRSNQGEVEPKVGIFWWIDGKCIVDSTPLSQAEPYGDALTHPTSHIDCWTRLQDRGLVSLLVEYEEEPRGRAGYDTKREEYFLYADRCILGNAAAVKAIIDALHLPRDTKPLPDSHYRCAKCLCRQRDI